MPQYLFCPDGSPLTKPEDIRPFLGKAIHWREGRSAFETAHSWFCAQDVPGAIRAVIETDSIFSRATLVKAIFEKQTELDSLGRPSQTDVLALLQLRSSRPAILGVEAKVDESFGPLVDDWKDGSPGKSQRLSGLIERLGISENVVGHLRYQLLHRAVATLIEAGRHHANDCAMVVQSFCEPPLRAGFSDFQAFAAALGVPVDKSGTLSAPLHRHGIALRLGWAEDRIRASRH